MDIQCVILYIYIVCIGCLMCVVSMAWVGLYVL